MILYIFFLFFFAKELYIYYNVLYINFFSYFQVLFYFLLGCGEFAVYVVLEIVSFL